MSHFVVGVITKNGTENEVNELLAPFQENNMGDCPKKYLKFYPNEESEIDEETNQRGYWENPNSKWDWFVIGGRWNNTIPLRSGKFTDRATIKDINLGIDQKLYDKAIRYWEVVVEGEELRSEENESDFFNMWKPQYYINQFGDRENFAKSQSIFETFAVITPEGEWFEKGEMGWWGMSSTSSESRQEFSKKFAELFEKYPEHYLTIVYCHI